MIYAMRTCLHPPRNVGFTEDHLPISGPRLALALKAATRKPVYVDCNAVSLLIRNMGGSIGEASALKMSYAGLTKGLIALGAAMALAAERAGVGQALHDELTASQMPMLKQLSRGVPDMFSKAGRWIAELDEIARFAGPGSGGGNLSGDRQTLREDRGGRGGL
jgi:hypothetical protein